MGLMNSLTSHNHGIPFLKMHGLGNDFVIIDARKFADPVTPGLARVVGDRHFGVGFDQLAVIHDDPDADVRLQFWNSDGSLSAACGNATRCIAALVIQETGRDHVSLRTDYDILQAEAAGEGLVRVRMGKPALDWDQIPLAEAADTISLPLPGSPGAVGMGNPHCVFIVDDAENADIAAHGAVFETHPMYPERTNVEMVQVLEKDRIRLRIWERGVGVTLASGSCSCAAVVATARKGLIERTATVVVDGGELSIDWREDGVWMTGPTQKVFSGVLSPDMLP